MVVRSTPSGPQLDQLFHALADATRRDIVARTLQREYSVSQLADLYPMSFAAVQKHVAVLEDARLVTKRAQHRHRFVRGNPEAVQELASALDALEHAWRLRIERFENELHDRDPEDA